MANLRQVTANYGKLRQFVVYLGNFSRGTPSILANFNIDAGLIASVVPAMNRWNVLTFTPNSTATLLWDRPIAAI